MDKITITGMPFFGYHGVLPEENKIGQRFIVDVVMGLDLHRAGKHDDLNASINYAEVYERVKAIVEDEEHYFLTIEALAEKIAAELRVNYQLLEQVIVTVHKPGAPIQGIFQDVSVTVER